MKRNPAKSGKQYRLAQAVAHGKARKTGMSKKVAREIIAKTPKGKRSKFTRHNPARKRNPEQAAARAYEDTHGQPPKVETLVETKIAYHKNLAGMGRLLELQIERMDRKGVVTVTGFGKDCILALNENQTQLFIVGGNQAVDLKCFGIRTKHEKQVLGLCRSVTYFTEKVHLIEKDGGKGAYEHKFKDPKPFIVYDARNKLLSFAGGGYSIPAEGIDG